MWNFQKSNNTGYNKYYKPKRFTITTASKYNILDFSPNEFPYDCSMHFEEFLNYDLKDMGIEDAIKFIKSCIAYKHKFLVIQLSVPGYDKEHLAVGYAGNKLFVTGKGFQKGDYVFTSIYRGKFLKEFTDVNHICDFSNMMTELKNGILKLRIEVRNIERKENPKTNYITIEEYQSS